jgi:hypothetical protein
MLNLTGHVHTDGPYAKYFPGEFNPDNIMKVIDYEKILKK